MSSAPQLSARDVNLIAMVFQSLKGESALQIDYVKLADLAGYKTAASANTAWLIIKKKLLAGAKVEGAAATTTTKKVKGKAATNGDVVDDEEAIPTKSAPKKGAKAIKTEPTDAEGVDADNEVTPAAESPKKGRGKKNTATTNTDANADTTTETATNPTPKRKRGPNKPKDPNAPPTKRGKKGVNAAAITTADTPADPNNEITSPTNGHESIFGGDANMKKEEGEAMEGEAMEGEAMEGDDRPFDAEEQKMVDNALFNSFTTEGPVA